MISIVDYGVGNIGSVRNMLTAVGVETEVVADPGALRRASKLILPGVGAFDAAAERLAAAGLRPALDERVLIDKVPILGICLGLQLMTRSSEEGVLPGLGYIAATTRRLPSGAGTRVPHMGWNLVARGTPCPLTEALPPNSRFYFAHSYAVFAEDAADVVLECTHGVTFAAAVRHANVMGVQFHPEKSHRFGKILLKSFAEHAGW